MRPGGPHRRHHFRRKLSGLDAAAFRQDPVEERAHDAGSGSRQSHQGESGEHLSLLQLRVQKLSELVCAPALSSLISAKHQNTIQNHYDTLRANKNDFLMRKFP